jgi:hypothetical protein
LAEPANAGLAALGVDDAWLTEAIERRGGRVLASELAVPTDVGAPLVQSLRNQWAHWFFAEALVLYPDNAAVQDHIARNAWLSLGAAIGADDPRVRAVVEALMGPIVRDYRTTATRLGDPGSGLRFSRPKAVLNAAPEAHLPHVEDAFAVFVETGILQTREDGEHVWGPCSARLAEFASLDTAPDVKPTHAEADAVPATVATLRTRTTRRAAMAATVEGSAT